MKKLLIALIVLGIVSSAHALQLSLTADPTIPTAYISGLLDQDVYVLLDSYEGISVTVGPDAGPGSGPTPPPPLIPVDSPFHPGWEEIWILISQTPPVAGDYMRIDGVAGDSVIAAWVVEATGGSVLMNPVTLVPEPMTIALLGLGGLFLLRRRKNKQVS